MEKNKIPVREIILLSLGECLVCAIVSVIFLLLGKFDYTVVLGGLLGAAVTVLNFLFLCVSVNRAIDKYISETNLEDIPKVSDNDSSDEENAPIDDAAAKLAKENQLKVQNAIRLSYIIRMLLMIAALVASAFIGIFNLIATVIPLLMFRPILNLSAMIKRKEK